MCSIPRPTSDRPTSPPSSGRPWRSSRRSACVTSCAIGGRTSGCSPTGTTGRGCSIRISGCGSISCWPAGRSPTVFGRRGWTGTPARAAGRAITRRSSSTSTRRPTGTSGRSCRRPPLRRPGAARSSCRRHRSGARLTHRTGDRLAVDNPRIADRLEAYASLLDLADANPYTARAYRRAAETIRSARVPVAELVRTGRVRELRGIGRGIEARLRELVETGDIAELAELERELAPGLVGLGRYLGLGAKRSVEIAQALGVRTPDELREAVAAGRLQTVPGIGPKTEARLVEALAREAEPRPQRGLLLNRARELVAGIADALDGEAAGDVRRWRDSCELLAVVCAAPDPSSALARFATLPQIVAVVEQEAQRAVGVTIEGVAVELIAVAPKRFGTALVRATGSPAYVAALEPLPDAPDEEAVYRALDLSWCPPEL